MVEKAIMEPEMSINQSGALFKKSCFFICNDGGLNHLSVAIEAPSLAIFWKTNPAYWSPEPVSGHISLCNPSWKDDSFGISPETAFDSAINLLNSEDTGGI